MRCPNCAKPVAQNDFQCASCELLLDPEAAQEQIVTEPSVVRALLAPPSRRPTTEVPGPSSALHRGAGASLGDEDEGSLGATLKYAAVNGDAVVPALIGGLELAGRLKDLDAYVTSFVDGRKNVADIALASSLGEVEVHAVLRALESRQVVALNAAIKPAAPAGPVPFPKAALRARPALQPASAPRPAAAAAPRVAAPSAPRPPAAAPPPPAPRPAPRLPRVLPAFVIPAECPKPVEPAAPARRPIAPAADSEENVLQRAVALERSGQVDGAIHVLERGISRVKNPAPLYNRLALVLVSQRRNYEEAERLLRHAMDLDPDNPVYTQNLYKVVGLSAANSGKKDVGGFLSRLTRRK